jgi:hypothetical protein
MPHYPRLVKAIRDQVESDVFSEWNDGDYATKEDAHKATVDRVEFLRPKGLMTARQVMQEIGTGVGRCMNPNIWHEALVRQIEKDAFQHAFVSDLRFPDELAAIQAAGGFVVRLTRDIHKGTDQHQSEHALNPDVFDWSKFDAIIDNANMTESETHEALLLVLTGGKAHC